MGTIELLRQAYVAGLDVRAVGGKLCVSGLMRYEPLALELLDHKSELMPILQAVAIYGPYGEKTPQLTPGDLPADWRLEWEERAAIREYDGGQAREHAEAEALDEILARMLTAGDHL